MPALMCSLDQTVICQTLLLIIFLAQLAVLSYSYKLVKMLCGLLVLVNSDHKPKTRSV